VTVRVSDNLCKYHSPILRENWNEDEKTVELNAKLNAAIILLAKTQEAQRARRDLRLWGLPVNGISPVDG
jgi:hypothetical protein